MIVGELENNYTEFIYIYIELTCFLPGAEPWPYPDLLSAARSPPP